MTWKKVLDVTLEHYFKKGYNAKVLDDTNMIRLKVIWKNWTLNIKAFEG